MDWQGEALSYARRTHFSLIGLSFALLVAATILPSASIEQAYSQLKAIDSVRLKYLTIEHVGTRIGQRKLDFFSNRETYEPAPGLMVIARQIVDKLNFTTQNGERTKIGSFNWGNTLRTIGAKRRATIFSNMAPIDSADITLARFKLEWDFLAKAFSAEVTNIDFDNIVALRAGNRVNLSSYLAKPADSPADVNLVSATFGIMEQLDQTRRFAPRKWMIMIELQPTGNSLPFDEIIIPIEVRYAENFGALQVVIPVEDASVPLGDFDDAFYDLVRLTKGLETLSLSPLLQYVTRLRDESEQRIQILGVEIPRTVISQWGVILLIALQIYFLLHIRRLRELPFTYEAIRMYPWVGLYPDRLSATTFYMSIVVLPVAAALFLAVGGVRGTTDTTYRILLVASTACSLGLSGVSAFGTATLRSRLLKIAP